MRLTSLNIKGFKSFAKETTINFNERVIGIVGPNGSGKSNIVDAIRWVLGEQKSKELRLEKMSNVIFNGTKKRRASGLAEVSLTFENTKNLLPTEYHTVTITRILYQSGDSEYRLNNVPCRLKDITSLFLDTGIGSNSYAIIALGMVDDLLADKEQARRKMFEQAAGISKYKKRKRETINKLKNTEADLERIEDLLFEIEGTLKELEKQARRTRRYYDLKDQYKEYSTELIVFKLSDLKSRYKELSGKLEKEEDQLQKFKTDATKFEAEIEQLQKANLDKEKALSSRQKELNELVNTIRDTENQKNIRKEKIRFLDTSQQKLNHQIELAKTKIEQFSKEVDSFQQRLASENTKEEDLKKNLAEAQDNLNNIKQTHSDLKTDLDEYLNNQQKLDRVIFEQEKTLAIQANQIENRQKELQKLEEEFADKTKEINYLEEQLNKLEQERKAKFATLSNLEKKELEREQKAQELEKDIEQVRKEIAEVNRQLDARRNEFKLTESMIENLEGFPESIKFLNKSKDWNVEAPLLSDLIFCKEEYRVTIENYLEPYLNYYIVQSLDEARKAIHLLHNAQRGKANFFILDAFKDYTPKMVLLPNTLQAIDLVETDPPYRNLISFLLENVVITENEELPRTLEQQDVVILSKSGRFVQRKYSLSGGSVGLFEGKKIGRKKNLEVLDISIQNLERQEQRLSSKFYTLKEAYDKLKANIKRTEIDHEKRVINQLDQQKVSLMTKLESMENFVRDAGKQKEDIQLVIKELKENNQLIKDELKRKKEKGNKAKEQISAIDENYRKIAEQLSEASEAYNRKNVAYIRQQNTVTTLRQELSFRQNQWKENQLQLETDGKNLTNAIKEKEQIEQLLVDMEKQLLDRYKQKEEKEASLTEAEQVYFKARGAIVELEDQLRKTNRKAGDTQSVINQLRDKYNEIKIEINSIAERVKIEFDQDINELINREPDDKYTLDALDQKVGRLKQRLDNYGEINPLALEAYEEMKIRFDNITNQRNDILEAKKSLMETIEEIEQTAVNQFNEAFDKVREYFKDVFRSLFTTSDTCDLLLTDPDDPLESPIDIIAKPKGKRPQSINQLSGGEKTLTAIALLFALYLLKPAPFCIFDEVDAPLDDANIDKFNNIIKEFSKDSQFVIVTHNKQTMAAVDVIYGVYMEEQGVSGVSPVDFRALKQAGRG